MVDNRDWVNPVREGSQEPVERVARPDHGCPVDSPQGGSIHRYSGASDSCAMTFHPSGKSIRMAFSPVFGRVM